MSNKNSICGSSASSSHRPLPMTRAEMSEWGWDALDILLVSGDAYVDHPSFGIALLGRWLVSLGYRTGIVAQPRWDTSEDLLCMGRPRLFAGVSAGCLDSMLAHYTAFRKKRHDDAYTPGGKCGARPNRASLVYSGLLRQAFPELPIVLGGIEASLRRAAHYDFWSDKIRHSIVLDSKADLAVYGMGERALAEIARRLAHGESGLHDIPGTVFVTTPGRFQEEMHARQIEIIELPSYEKIVEDRFALMRATLEIERQVHQRTAWALQRDGNRLVVCTPPAPILTTDELDRIYCLPFTRRPHPSYRAEIPAASMIQFSVTSHRGCGGGCSFCALALHQGRRIASRSASSLHAEIESLTQHPDWRGALTDVGGPSANMWGASCAAHAPCTRTSCLTPRICPHFHVRQAELATMLQSLRQIPGINHLRVASGIRYDLAIQEDSYLDTLIGEFVGGQLKIAPEHCCDPVLRLMRKPPFEVFETFLRRFEQKSRASGKTQFVIPYLISAFPGCTLEDMKRLGDWLRQRNWKPQQVQCFIPTPGTVATAMYYSGMDSEGNPIPVARSDAERLQQHHVLMADTPLSKKRRPK